MRAVDKLGLEWLPPVGPWRPGPFYPEVHDGIANSWNVLLSRRVYNRGSSLLSSVDGADQVGYVKPPEPVERPDSLGRSIVRARRARETTGTKPRSSHCLLEEESCTPKTSHWKSHTVCVHHAPLSVADSKNDCHVSVLTVPQCSAIKFFIYI